MINKKIKDLKKGCGKDIQEKIIKGDIIVQTDGSDNYPKKLYNKCGLTEIEDELFLCSECKDKLILARECKKDFDEKLRKLLSLGVTLTGDAQEFLDKIMGEEE